MALWEKIQSRGQIEDRRGAPSRLLVGGGGLGILGIALTLFLTLAGGGDINDVVDQLQGIQVVPQSENAKQFEGKDSYEVFASTVLGSNNDMWRTVFAQAHKEYVEPKLVLFRTATESACGVATSAVGPHYCPLDQTVYLDETFFKELTNILGAQGGDVAEAYVISHEVGHHAQNLLGILDSENTNEDSIKTELQADCFAGLWAYSIRDLGVLQFGEINEAMNAAAAVGDDRIQQKIGGRVNPETWTHGSSTQRVSWFNQGYQNGNVDSCNTFR